MILKDLRFLFAFIVTLTFDPLETVNMDLLHHRIDLSGCSTASYAHTGKVLVIFKERSTFTIRNIITCSSQMNQKGSYIGIVYSF